MKIIEKLVLEDTRIRIKVLAEITKLPVGTIHAILHDYLKLTKVSARWVPRMLTALPKQVRVDSCKEFLELCGDDPPSFFERIVTGD